MPEYTLYCFAESGNSYKAALMLALCGLDWQARKVDYFNGETRSPEYRATVNELGEVPVLEDGAVRLSQSGVILDYLASRTGKFAAENEDERREVWRWMLYDNHKFTSYIATLRFLTSFARSGETPVTEFLRQRAQTALGIVDAHLTGRDFMIGSRPTIADLSMCGYYYYGGELGLQLSAYPNVLKWLERIAALPGWQHPYDLMPRAYTG